MLSKSATTDVMEQPLPIAERDCQAWLDRWDRMQERYLPARKQRFELMAWLVRETQPPAPRVLDLGCGTGSLMHRLLTAVPGTMAVGIDLDFMLLPLARERLAPWGERVGLIEADLRTEGWVTEVREPVHAIVSATALHWLSAAELAQLYQRLGRVLRPGGVFLNADHVGSTAPQLQRAWEHRRDAATQALIESGADDYDGFWNAYLGSFSDAVRARRQRLHEPYRGIEQGMPLHWHLDRLREAGFVAVDCFWRQENDAIYGAFRKE
jgi:SAM-dependent methyltransferase